MYKISVPLMNSIVKRSNREKLLNELTLLNAQRIFLALDTYETDENEQARIFAELEDNCRFFKEKGFEVGAWIWTFLFHADTDFTPMRTILGEDLSRYICPSDERFVAFAEKYVKRIAKCGVDIIMYDDDFRYGYFALPACLCDNHVKMINEMTSSSLTREEIQKYISSGEENIYRSAYLKANGDTLRHFAGKMRDAVNEVDPTVRLGACACMSSWDLDGTDVYEMATILAGNTKPFARLIGAPYWAVQGAWGNRLQDVVELERMESAWTRRGDIELMAEGDVYPRPRTNCPASYLEGFDTAIRVSGCTDGILKYAIDYHSNADYETSYRRYHQRNISTYQMIDEFFGNKTSVGIRVYESMKKVETLKIPTAVNEGAVLEDLFFSKASRCLAFSTIPTVFEGSGVTGMVFDENARHLPEGAFEKGLIIDIAAAEILSEQGIDVGLHKINKPLKQTKDVNYIVEHFIDDNNYVSVGGCTLYDITINEKATVLSDMEYEGNIYPLSYRYENENGQRFLVFNVNTRSNSDNYLKSHERARQIKEGVKWLGGEELPAYSYGNPCLYTQCKKDLSSLAVGLWSFYPDYVQEPVIELDKEYSSIRFINCSGRLEGSKVYLDDIPAYTFAAFEVR